MIDSYNSDHMIKMVTYSDTDITRAKEFTATTLKTLLYPVKTIPELDKMYNEYLAMSKHSRFESDEACRIIFGCNNRDFYSLYKAHLLKIEGGGDDANKTIEKSDDEPKESVSVVEQALLSESILNPLDEETIRTYKPSNFITSVAQTDTLRLGYFQPNTDYECPAEFPYFTSVEIIANKAQLDDIPDGYLSIMGNVAGYFVHKEWFEGLQAAEKGIITESYRNQVSPWIDSVRKACYEHFTNPSELTEQVLLYLGWNPQLEFTPENRVLATNRFNKTIHEAMRFQVIDMSAPLLEENILIEKTLIEPMKKVLLYPVYIVLVEGATLFSAITKKVTDGPFSHAAISLDESLENMYSFAINDNVNGFSIENIKNYPQTHRLGVFTIFVKEQEYHTIKSMMEYYVKNAQKTSYSFLNLMALPFKKAIKMDFSMICSEFVDNLLKLCNINITDKDSPLVTPNDFYRASGTNNKIYKIYDGEVRKYKHKVAYSKVYKLLSSGKYIKEACLFELKEFPVQFSQDGDLLIRNMKKLNYEDEYNSSHKLLLAYKRYDNIEGMKYELCKLWFLNQLLEKDIYSKKNAIANSKCRSRVLNDFNTYINIVLKSEPDFNFTSYYASTPFSDAVIKINGSTLRYTLDYIKKALAVV